MPNKMRNLVLILIMLICNVPVAKAAFPIREETVVVNIISAASTASIITTPTSLASLPEGNTTKKVKSKGTAAVLAYFLGFTGAHRFYLGYDWQAVMQVFTYPLIIGGILLASEMVFVGPALFVPIFLIAAGYALGIWEFVDFIRILCGTLKPKNGEYPKRKRQR